VQLLFGGERTGGVEFAVEVLEPKAHCQYQSDAREKRQNHSIKEGGALGCFKFAVCHKTIFLPLTRPPPPLNYSSYSNNPLSQEYGLC